MSAPCSCCTLRYGSLAPLHHHREVSVVSSFGTFWSEGRVAILHFSRRAMAFLWSSSSVPAYRPLTKPSFPLSEISSMNMRLHPAARREVTEVQHPGKSPVTIRDVPIDPTPGQNQSLDLPDGCLGRR